MSDDPLQNRIKKYEYLTLFLERFTNAQNLVPQVYRDLVVTKWEIDMLSNLPDEADEISDKEMREHFNTEMQYLPEALPMMPAYDTGLESSSDGIMAAGSALSYGYAAHIGDLGTPKAREFSYQFTTQYQEIQKKLNRPDEIRNLLIGFPSQDILTRFDSARESYLKYKAGVGKRTSTANEMRNFVNGLKGDLFQMVFQPKENKSWHEMAKRLSNDYPSGYIFNELLHQEEKQSEILSGLADILKDREGNSLTNIDHIWTKLLDYAYIVLKLIDHGKNNQGLYVTF